MIDCCAEQKCPKISLNLTTFSVDVRLLETRCHRQGYKSLETLVNNWKHSLMASPNLNHLADD